MRMLKITLLCLAVATAIGCKPDAPKTPAGTTTAKEEPKKDEPKNGEADAVKMDTTAGAALAAGGKGDATKGQATYEKVCAACHAVDGKGNGGVTAPDFSKDPRLESSDAVLLTSISEGKQGKVGVMPAQKDALSADEIRDALAYVRATFAK